MKTTQYSHETKQDNAKNSNEKQCADSKSTTKTTDGSFNQHLNYFGTGSSIKL